MDIYKRFLVDRWGRRKDDFDWRVFQTTTDLRSVDGILVLHLNDRLGDALVISMLVDALARARPDLRIAVGTTEPYAEYWRRDPRVGEVAILPCSRKLGRRMGRRIREARRGAQPWRGRFDVVVSFEPYALPDHFALIRTLRAKINIGFNKHVYRLFTYALDERRHGVVATPIAERTARVMEVFGETVDCRNLDVSVPYGPDDEAAARAVVERLATPGARLLLNTYGFGPEKHLTPAAVARAVRVVRQMGHAGPIYLSVPPGEAGSFEATLREAGSWGGVVAIAPMADVFKLFALVARMDVVISPDTAVGHVAAAFRKPQIAIFAQWGSIPVAWKPYNARCRALVSTTGLSVDDLDWEGFTSAVCGTLAESGESPPLPERRGGEGRGLPG